MSTPLMPELPKPPEHDEVITNSYGSGHSDYQLQQYARAYGLAVWKAAMEAAEDRIKRMRLGFDTDYSAGFDAAIGDCLVAIEAMKERPLPESDMTQARGE